MSDEQDKSYIEELTDMWTEDAWLFDEVNEENRKREELENSFSYFASFVWKHEDCDITK